MLWPLNCRSWSCADQDLQLTGWNITSLHSKVSYFYYYLYVLTYLGVGLRYNIIWYVMFFIHQSNDKVKINQFWIHNDIHKLTSGVNSLRLNDAYMREFSIPTLLQIMACRLFITKPLYEPMLPYCKWNLILFSVKFCLKFKSFHSRKCHWKYCLQNGCHFVSVSMCSLWDICY